MSYQEALDYIASLAPRGWRLGLDRMQAFVEKAGLTDSLGTPGGPQYIHVAGTNGKGSVVAYLQSLLVEAGYRTGAFFSPYVYDPRERVQFGREMISKDDFASLTEELRPIAESFTETEFGGITEFEFKTAMGFLYWKRMRCEWVALEVGLGGRLDATNVVTPRASVIVSIGLDHTAILGNTLKEIAFEKAGITKPGVPVVAGALPEGAMRVVQRVARENSSVLWRYGCEIRAGAVLATPAGNQILPDPAIPGERETQLQNAALAIAALEAAQVPLQEQAIQKGITRAALPGRFEMREHRGRTFLLDGGHNADSARVLRRGLEALSYRRLVLITNMVAGHEPADFYREIVPLASSAHTVPIDFHRALSPLQAAEELRKLGLQEVTAHGTPEGGIEAALEESQPEDLILVTGSFYLVGEVGNRLSRGT